MNTYARMHTVMTFAVTLILTIGFAMSTHVQASSLKTAYVMSDIDGQYNIWQGTFDGNSFTYDQQITFLSGGNYVTNFKIDPVNERIVYSSYPSPDGNRIHDLHVIDYAGNLIRHLDNMPGTGGGSSSFDISPDGSELVFSEGRTDQGLNMQVAYKINMDNTNLRQFLAANAVRGTNTHKSALIWADDGSIIFSNTRVWSDYAGQHDIHVHDGNGISAWSQNSSSGEGNVMTLSDDGTMFATRTLAYGKTSGIDIASWPNGSRTQLFAQNTGTTYLPELWLDNSTLVYRANGELYAIDIVTRDTTNLTQTGNVNEAYLQILDDAPSNAVPAPLAALPAGALALLLTLKRRRRTIIEISEKAV